LRLSDSGSGFCHRRQSSFIVTAGGDFHQEKNSARSKLSSEPATHGTLAWPALPLLCEHGMIGAWKILSPSRTWVAFQMISNATLGGIVDYGSRAPENGHPLPPM
jgi:hypothetical protein